MILTYKDFIRHIQITFMIILMNMIRRIFSLLVPAALVAVGCAEKELPVLNQPSAEQTKLDTKCLNSPQRAEAGTLLLYLDDAVAQRDAQAVCECVADFDGMGGSVAIVCHGDRRGAGAGGRYLSSGHGGDTRVA